MGNMESANNGVFLSVDTVLCLISHLSGTPMCKLAGTGFLKEKGGNSANNDFLIM